MSMVGAYVATSGQVEAREPAQRSDGIRLDGSTFGGVWDPWLYRVIDTVPATA
jgi:hypothetical protein